MERMPYGIEMNNLRYNNSRWLFVCPMGTARFSRVKYDGLDILIWQETQINCMYFVWNEKQKQQQNNGERINWDESVCV